MKKRTAIIIGAGPAGLTAGYELLEKTDITPIILEKTSNIGGISKTVEYKGNRIDIGGHRFFSKSDRVMNWWFNILPLQKSNDSTEKVKITYHNTTKNILTKKKGPDSERTDEVMLIRNRLSRIYYLRKFFDYPVSLSWNTISNLGLFRMIKIGLSYIKIKILPIKNEKTLEDFFINRFGKELYLTFFKEYTEKVWGVPCHAITSEWGAQRIKGLSVSKVLGHAIKSVFKRDQSVKQKNTETSLIEQFAYPKFGPGQMWEKVAEIIKQKGGEVILNANVIGIDKTEDKITSVDYINHEGNKEKLTGDYFFSTMPVKDLIVAMPKSVPNNVINTANGLMYRDFITVGLLLNNLKIKNLTKIKTKNDIVPDNWIYIQERDVKVGRLQIFNNWSPYMVKDSDTVWIGLEYFCNEGDDLWNKPDTDFVNFAIKELEKIDIIDSNNVLDSTIIRMPKTYPSYFGTYEQFDEIRKFTDKIENLFLIGRNGMHRYNNADHSMLTAMKAVDNIIEGKTDKSNIWNVNTEEEYHEEK